MKERKRKEKRPGDAPPFKVAVVQAASVAFDRERTLDKVRALAKEAARKGARLVLFPEAFVSAYPRGMDFGAAVGSCTDASPGDWREPDGAQPAGNRSGVE